MQQSTRMSRAKINKSEWITWYVFFKEIKQTTRKQRARKHQNLTLSAIRRERVGRGWFVEAHLYFLWILLRGNCKAYFGTKFATFPILYIWRFVSPLNQVLRWLVSKGKVIFFITKEANATKKSFQNVFWEHVKAFLFFGAHFKNIFERNANASLTTPGFTFSISAPHCDSRNFVKTLKIHVKLILNCPRAHAITYIPIIRPRSLYLKHTIRVAILYIEKYNQWQ